MADIELLRDIERDLSTGFAERRHVLSFDEFFEAFAKAPRLYLRTSAEYLRDCIASFGTEEIERPTGAVVRYRLFDCPWNDGKGRVVGQEQAQHAFFRLLNNFVRERRVTRLIMLHGPNGSAKSSFVDCIAQGLEHYSTLDEGAVYRFNWIFPSANVAKKRLGFGASGGPGALTSFAHLEDDDIDARLPADLYDHPLFLLPKDARNRLVDRLAEEGALPRDEPIGEYLIEGDLAPRSHAIFGALLNAYHGDMQRVLQHVQVERFYFSRRYRRGVVTIEPQLHVDASLRQVTMDKGLQSLPSALKSLSLYEPFGDLVDANRGLINYNDLLKKPIDAFKYLLATCEKGTVSLPQAILHLDLVFVASSNEHHIRAFKEYPDWPSFKGRMDLVKMPYLRNFRVEQAIYDEQLDAGELSAHVVPHATYVLALWAVLTRLKRPAPDAYPTQVRDIVARLTPMEKATLYAEGRGPRDLSAEQARELRAVLKEITEEGQQGSAYEGSFGASPREMKQVLMNALQDKAHWGISPLGVIDQLREIIKGKSVYEYLKLEADGGYHDYSSFIDQVFAGWLDRVDGELQTAMGLVNEHQYDELFSRYIRHVSYVLKGEKLYNDATGRYEEPDRSVMERLEGVWEITGDRERFRQDLVARVGAWRIGNRDKDMDYRELFPKLFEALESEYYGKQKTRVRRMCEQLVTVLVAADIGEDPTHHGMEDTDVERALVTIERLHDDFGYGREPLRDVLTTLLKHRY